LLDVSERTADSEQLSHRFANCTSHQRTLLRATVEAFNQSNLYLNPLSVTLSHQRTPQQPTIQAFHQCQQKIMATLHTAGVALQPVKTKQKVC